MAGACGGSCSHERGESCSEGVRAVSWSCDKRLGGGPWRGAEDACGGFPVDVEVMWVSGNGLHD